MRHHPIACAVVLALCLTAAGLAHAGVKERLARGEVVITTKAVPDSQYPKLKALALIKAPPEKVWPLVERCRDYKNFMPRVVDSKELLREPNHVRCQVTLEVPVLGTRVSSVTDVVHVVDEAKHTYKRTWKMVEGDYKANQGSWTLLPYDAEGKVTLAAYEAHAEPKAPIPVGVLRAVQSKSIPEMFEVLRKRLE